MNLVCIVNDIPYPAMNGGRVDVWRRLIALKDCGHKIALICWVDVGRDSPPQGDTLKKIESVCDQFVWLPITRSPIELIKRSMQLWRWPSHVAARFVTVDKKKIVDWASNFNPDYIWLDGLYGGALALYLSNKLDKPLLFRSHNIEHQYMADQRRLETRLSRRVGLLANSIGLERFERHIISKAQRVYDISESDAQYWQRQGYGKKIRWLPTSVDDDFAERLNTPITSGAYDILYFGNLTTPNNIKSVIWLVEFVLPLLADANLKIAIAGSNPAELVRKTIGADNRITLIDSPKDIVTIITQARVLVNPMQAGSGVNLKSVEMLFTQAALVSTSVGVRGLSTAAQACFSLADTPIEFAKAIRQSLLQSPDLTPRINVRKAFSPAEINTIFAQQA